MLYLETPVGAGFSYDSSNSSAYEVVTDAITARDNLVFLHKWFLKFPQYKQRDLFITGESYAITGESYAGHYIPQLAELMVRFNKKQKLFNLKGIAVLWHECGWQPVSLTDLITGANVKRRKSGVIGICFPVGGNPTLHICLIRDNQSSFPNFFL